MSTQIDFPLFIIPAKYVDSTKTGAVVNVQFLNKAVSANYVYSGEPKMQEAVQSGIVDLLAADIEANYKTAVTYPTVLPTWHSSFGVSNADLIFTGTSSGTAGEVVAVVAVTAHQAGVTVAVSSNTATISLSDTAAGNTANAVVTAWNAATAATALATISLWPGTRNDGTKRNDGTGLVPVFASQQLLQSNTYQQAGQIRIISCQFSVGHK